MMPPPAPARPLISASDIPPPLLPASPGRRITGASRAKQDSTPPPPNRVASAAACSARSVSLDCGRRKRGGGGVESTRALGSARRVPLRCRAFRWSSEFRPLQLTLPVPCARRPVPCDLIPTPPPGPVLKSSPPSTHAFLMASCPSTTGSQRSSAHHLTCSLNFESGFGWEEFAEYLTAEYLTAWHAAGKARRSTFHGARPESDGVLAYDAAFDVASSWWLQNGCLCSSV